MIHPLFISLGISLKYISDYEKDLADNVAINSDTIRSDRVVIRSSLYRIREQNPLVIPMWLFSDRVSRTGENCKGTCIRLKICL